MNRTLDNKTKKPQILKKIKTRDDALTTIKDIAIVFFILAIMQLIVVAIQFPPILDVQIFESAIHISVAIILWYWQSRVAAIILLILSGGGLIMMMYHWFAGGPVNLVNPAMLVLALIITAAAVRAVQATFLLHDRFGATAKSDESSG